jgi:hypothetical protein
VSVSQLRLFVWRKCVSEVTQIFLAIVISFQ